MARVDYDQIAASYDSRYERHDYSGVGEAVDRFATGRASVLEVGCGTGHWLARLLDTGGQCYGVDYSDEMLGACRAKLPSVPLVRASGIALPFARASLDGVLAVNALHHFGDTALFLEEARRVLRDGGALLTIGLDPSLKQDRWYVYDYFEGALERDCERYASTESIRATCRQLGFEHADTFIAQSYTGVPARRHLEAGGSAKQSSSQLALLTDAEYEAGMARIWADIAEAESRSEVHELRGDIHLFGTLAIA